MRRVAVGGRAFYIGICSDPVARWSEGDNRHDCRFEGMLVAVGNDTDSRSLPLLEQALIAVCRANPRCLNVGDGGERAHAGIRWLYIAYRADGLLRR